MRDFLEALRIQRWDDHRYYHHSLVNQSLHCLSAISFCVAYVMMVKDPAMAAVVAWLVAMLSRQAGHFFFEPRDYDHVNQATDAYKEAIKVGYNIRRKIVLMAVWAASPLLVWFSPTVLGLLPSPQGMADWVRRIGTVWFAVGIGGLLFRVGQLCVTRDMRTGFAWAAKIITDPFHDLRLYWKSPYRLLRRRIEDASLATGEEPEKLGVSRP